MEPPMAFREPSRSIRKNPGAATGKIVVATKFLTVPNSMMQELSARARNGRTKKANPQRSPSRIKKISDIEKEGTKGEAEVTGTFTLNGVSKEITVEAKVKLPARQAPPPACPARKATCSSFAAEFKIKRSDYNIQAGQNTDKVSDEIELELSIAGSAPKA